MKNFFLLICIMTVVWPVYGYTQDEILRYAVSKKLLNGFNENDAIASIKIWTGSLAANQMNGVEPLPTLYEGKAEIGESVTTGKDDVYYITLDEYFSYKEYFDQQRFIVAIKNDSPHENYLLLVNNASGVSSLEDLSNSSVVILNNSRMDLGRIWLETHLMEQQLGTIKSYFESVTTVSKINEAILPVFFQKNAACFVTRDGFETMAELNPQLKRQLSIIAESPPLIPGGLFFRKEFVSPIKDILYTEIEGWVEDPSYRQLSLIFQMDGLKSSTPPLLDDSLQVLERHATLKGLKTP